MHVKKCRNRTKKAKSMISKIINESLIQETKREIEKVNNIVIVSHLSPDGDSVGSSLAWANFLSGMEKNVTVIIPNAYPDYYGWMWGIKDVLVYDKQSEAADEKIKEAEVIFALDFNVLSRIGDMGLRVADAKGKKILVDHHLDPGNFADIVISYPQMTSTSEMIFRLICRMGYFTDMTQECAECIFVGLMTDTGSFSYNSNNPELYTIISELIKKGVDKDEIYRRVYNNFSESRFRMLGFLLNKKLKIYPELGAALMFLTKEELNTFDYRPGDTEGFVNIPLSIKGVVFSAFFKEDIDKIRISFRSQGEVAANVFAHEYFNGGGHKNAAGGTLHCSIYDAVKLFDEKIPLIKEELQKERTRQAVALGEEVATDENVEEK